MLFHVRDAKVARLRPFSHERASSLNSVSPRKATLHDECPNLDVVRSIFAAG